MVYSLDETGRQELSDFFVDEPPLLLVEAAQALFDRPGTRPDLQDMLSDFPRNSRHVRGFPRKDVSIDAKEVNEHAFLLGGEGGADAHRLVGGVVDVDEDLLDVLHRLKGFGRPLHVGRSFGDVLPDGCEFLGSQGCQSELVALDLELIGPLERSADGDDPTWAQHLELEVGVVGDGHELRVTWSPQNGMVDRGEPDYLEGEGPVL